MITKTDFYKMMTTILDRRNFNFNHENESIRLSLPLNLDDIRNLRQTILLLFGNPNIPQHDWHLDPINCAYKFNSHYVDVDEQTIKIDQNGRLYVAATELKEQIRKEILEDEKFLKRLELKVIRSIRNKKKQCCCK